jgi:outer membrane receptor protein involved in Fe transport
VGSNYQVDHDLAVFARVSDGVSFNADRAISGPGSQNLDGSVPVPINEVEQYEGGVKYRLGNLSTFLSLFDADTQEHNYDVTTGVTSSNKYNAYGAELEFGYLIGSFRVTGGATYTHARITETNEANAKNKKPQRQADWVYQIAPSYDFGRFSVGASAIGTSSSYGDDQNDIVMPGYVVFNAFASYQITSQLSALLTANNLANAIAYTELDGIGGGTAASARAYDGRTVTGTLRYSF